MRAEFNLQFSVGLSPDEVCVMIEQQFGPRITQHSGYKALPRNGTTVSYARGRRYLSEMGTGLLGGVAAGALGAFGLAGAIAGSTAEVAAIQRDTTEQIIFTTTATAEGATVNVSGRAELGPRQLVDDIVARLKARGGTEGPSLAERMARLLEQSELKNISKRGRTGSATVTCVPDGDGLRCTGIVTASDGSAAEKTWVARLGMQNGSRKWLPSLPTVRVLQAEPPTGCPRCRRESPELAWCAECAARLVALRSLPVSERIIALLKDMDKASNERNFAFIDERYSPDYQGHPPDRPAPTDKRWARESEEKIAAMCADLSSEHMHIVEDGDRVWADFQAQLTANDETHEIHGVASYRLAGGLIAESWTYIGLMMPE